MPLRIKRVYDDPEPADGRRILVDRLWPRGLSKEKAALDEWAREIAPSNELRRWFHGEGTTWEEFRDRYTSELDGKPELVEALLRHIRAGTVTLLYASRNETRNNAVVLREYLQHKGGE